MGGDFRFSHPAKWQVKRSPSITPLPLAFNSVGRLWKYFIDTHDKTKGSFPVGELTEEQFLAQFVELEKVAPAFDAFAHAAHVNLKEGKAFCFMCGPDEESIRKAHEAVHLRYDSITEVKRVTGADMRLSRLASKAPQKR